MISDHPTTHHPLRHAIKTLPGDGLRVGGYLVVFGDPAHRDLTGEYFHKATDLGLGLYPRLPMLYQHGQDSTLGSAVIGVIDTFRLDEIGLWIEAELDKHSKYLSALQQLIARGALALSSGSLPHLVAKSADGRIDRWWIVEGSATPQPAQPYRTTLSAVKAAYAVLGLDSSPVSSPVSQAESHQDEEITLDELNALTQTVSTLTEAVKGLQVQSSQTASLHAAALQSAQLFAQQNTPANSAIKRLPSSLSSLNAPVTPSAPRLEVTRATKYSELSAADMSFLYELLSGAGREWRPDAAFFREVADKSVKAVNAGTLPYDAVRGLTEGGYLKSQELDNSAQTGYGLEWVADSWRSELWLRVRQDNVVASLFEMLDMATNPYELPIESADPSVYYVPETTDQQQLVLTAANPIPESKVASTKITMRAQKLALRMAWSSELNEDSLIPIVANYRRQAIRAMQNAIDNVLLNGDTTATANANVNLIDGTPTTGAKYLAFNGVRKYCLVTNTAQSMNANGPLTLPMLRKTRFLLNGAYALRPRDCAWIVDDLTYAKLLSMPEFATMDKAGAAATNLSGQVGVIDGVPVFASAEMGLSQAADGKLSGTASNNTKGQAIIVFRPLWYVGYRRQVSANIDFIPWADVYHLTLTARLTVAVQDAASAAMIYNASV